MKIYLSSGRKATSKLERLKTEPLLVFISAVSNSDVYHMQTLPPLTPSFWMAKAIFAFSNFSTYTPRISSH